MTFSNCSNFFITIIKNLGKYAPPLHGIENSLVQTKWEINQRFNILQVIFREKNVSYMTDRGQTINRWLLMLLLDCQIIKDRSGELINCAQFDNLAKLIWYLCMYSYIFIINNSWCRSAVCSNQFFVLNNYCVWKLTYWF